VKLESVLKVHLLRNTQIKHEFSKQDFPPCMFAVWGNLGLRLLIGGSGFRIRHSIGGILHNFQETNERLN